MSLYYVMLNRYDHRDALSAVASHASGGYRSDDAGLTIGLKLSYAQHLWTGDVSLTDSSSLSRLAARFEASGSADVSVR